MTEPTTDTKLLDRVRTHLQDIPALYDQVAMFKTPGSAPPDPDARRGTSNPSRPTVSLDVVDLTDVRQKDFSDADTGRRDLEVDRLAGYRRLGVLPTLGLWVSMVYVERIDSGEEVTECCGGTGDHTVAGEVAWLLFELDLILDHHPDFAKDVDWIRSDLQRACGIRPPEEAYCPKCTNKVEGRDEDSWFQCVGCGSTWVAGAEIQRLFALQPPMTLRQISDLLTIPLRTLYNWRTEGRFMPVNHDPRFRKAMQKAGNAKVFDVEHVKRAATRVAATA